jgi:hypothetical protein
MFKTKKNQGYEMGSLPPQGSRNKPPISQGSNRDLPAFNLGYEKNKPSIKKQGNK